MKKVLVIDSGVAKHPRLKDVKICTTGFRNQHTLDDIYDKVGHGTAVVSLISNQTHRFDFVHEAYKSKKKFYHTIVYRYMYLSELIDLLQKTGFNIIKVDEHMNYGTNVAVVAQRKS